MLATGGCGGDSGSSAAGGDTTRPTHGTAIKFSDITSDSFTITWGEGSDNVTSAASLQYKVVKADSFTKLNLVSRAESLTGDDIISDWSSYVPSIPLDNLSSETVFWINVIVKDEAGNMEVYAASSVRTLSNEAPVPGADISFTDTSTESTTVNWGAATDPNPEYTRDELWYRVLRSEDYTKIDTVDEANDAGEGVVQVLPWTTGYNYAWENLSCPDSGLVNGTRYFYAVLVKNPDEKIALYTPKVVTTIDITPPVAGSAVNFADITTGSVTVKWGKASDLLSPETALQYRVVRASTSGAIDSISEVEGITGGGVVMEWTANATQVADDSLTEYTDYWYAVLVKDEAGNKSLYAPQTMQTLDGLAPSIPVDDINFSDVTGTSITASWAAADDAGRTLPGDLEYRLVKSLNVSDIDTKEEVLLIDTPGEGFVAEGENMLTHAVDGLDDGVTYYFSVLVRDSVGNAALYTPRSQMTLDVTTPEVGADIDFGKVAATWVDVSWGKANDNTSAQSALTYTLVRATAAADIDTFDEIKAIEDVPTAYNPVINKAADVATARAEGLTVGVTYHFSLMVRDEAGNYTIYPQKFVTTVADVTAPAAGAGMSFSNVKSTSVVVNWGKATDNISEQTALRYTLVRADAAADIDTFNEIKAIEDAGPSANLVLDKGVDFASAQATGLTDGNTYYFSLLVRDESNNYVIYPQANVTTAKSWEVLGTAGFATITSDSPYFSLAVNSSGTPYVAFSDGADSNKVTVMKFDGSDWAQVGDDLTSAAGSEIGLKFDGTVPYVVYRGTDNKATVKKFTTAWEVVGTTESFTPVDASSLSLAIDNANTAHVAFCDASVSGEASVMKDNTTAWTNLGSAGFSSDVTPIISIAFDGAVPYVSFKDGNTTGVDKLSVMKYTVATTSWDIVSEDISAGEVYQVRMAISASSALYVAYQDASLGYKGVVLQYSGSSWADVGGIGTGSTDPFTPASANGLDFAVVGSNLYTAFGDGAVGGRASVMMSSGAAWSNIGTQGFSPALINNISLAVDSTGKPYVAFRDSTNDNKLTVMVYK